MTADPASATSAPATTVKSSGSTASPAQLAYPHGHLGHLSEREGDALERLKDLLEKEGAWTRGPPASHDDQTLLRFLRARRWVPEDAFKQFKDTEDWMRANHIDTLYRTIEVDAYEQSRRLYPQWTGRRDHHGIPVFVFDVKQLDPKTVSEYERQGAKSTFSDAQTDGKTPSGLLRLFALYENLTRFTQPLCTQLVSGRDHPDVPITMSTNIVDITGVGLKQFWSLKGHMQSASQLATAHYPETLDRIFVIGAPFFFSTIWGWVRRWFDPATVSKIHVLSPNDVRPVLERFIDPANIPKKYGGDLDFAFGQAPVPDPAMDDVVSWENGFTSFPTGPLLWEEEEIGGEGLRSRLVCIAVGKENGKQRHARVCTVPKVWSPAGVLNGRRETAISQGASYPVEETKQTTNSEKSAVTQADASLFNGQLVEKLKLEDNMAAHAPQPATATV